MAVVDATFLLAIERQDPPALALLARLTEEREPLRIPATVWIDYLSAFDPRRRHEAVQRLAKGASFEPIDRETADEAARLQYELGADTQGDSWVDLLVAATCLRLQERLVSSDDGYDGVPGLVRLAH